MTEEWVDCTRTFSNGTEYELFLEGCERCTRYRAARCRIVQACEKARFDERFFPYKDLQDHARYGGKRCRHFTTEKPKRKKRIGLPGQISIDDMTNAGRNSSVTLCWSCANACGGCSWSDHWEHKPVPGWKAKKVLVKTSLGYEPTYTVEECPEFEPDRRADNGH